MLRRILRNFCGAAQLIAMRLDRDVMLQRNATPECARAIIGDALLHVGYIMVKLPCAYRPARDRWRRNGPVAGCTSRSLLRPHGRVWICNEMRLYVLPHYVSMHHLHKSTSSPLCVPPLIKRHLSRLARHATPFTQHTPRPHPYNLLDCPLIAHEHSQALRPRLLGEVAPRVWI